jgi:hypothetical protein
MTNYTGDKKPFDFVVGTALNIGTAVTFTSQPTVLIAQLAKPVLYAQAVTTGTGATGSMIVVYKLQISEFTTATASVNITMTADGSSCSGLTFMAAQDYSGMVIVSVTNNMSQDLTEYRVGITGMQIY